MLARRRTPEAKEAIRDAKVAMERFVELAAEQLMMHVQAIRDAAIAGREPTEDGARKDEVEEAWLDFEAHLTALRVVHGERLAAKKLKADSLHESFRAFSRIATARGLEVIERTDNL